MERSPLSALPWVGRTAKRAPHGSHSYLKLEVESAESSNEIEEEDY